MADAADLKSVAERREGSNPSPGTNLSHDITDWSATEARIAATGVFIPRL